MKLATKTFRGAIAGAALAAILATTTSAQAPSWPTPPAPPPQTESPALQAESPTAPQTKPASHFTPGRLAQMLAPIALYPDDLLAVILMAATYPLDVVEAARWLQEGQNAALKGDQLFAALQQKPWDPSVKALAPFPRILSMLDANLEWTEQLGEAYLADPAAVMDAIQRLRRRAQSAGRLVTTSQEIVRIEEPITIEAPGPEVVYIPICDPSFVYGPWPYPDFPPFVPLFAGGIINGCGWFSGPIVAPFFGFAILNFHKQKIEINRKRLALFDRDREKDREHPLGEEWRHDPGHRGNVPYRDAAVRALFQDRAPAANFNPALRGRWTSPSSVGGDLASPAPVAQSPDAERRILIEQWSFVRVPTTAMVPPPGGSRATPLLGRMGSARALDDRRFFRSLVGVGAQPFDANGARAIGVQPFNGQGSQAPFGGMGAGSSRGGH